MTHGAAVGGVRWLGPALGAGAALGVVYTLSPLSVLSLAALAGVVWWAARDLGPRERRWFLWLVCTGIGLRLAAIALLFLTANPDQAFASFFGDEELFKSRPVWIRNLGLGVPISPADVIYAYDDTGKSSYLYVLAYIQALVGDAPYSIHVLNATAYLSGVLVLYRLARAGFGRLPAMGGLVVLLWLPSLFAWSISALKEPMYTVVAVFELLCVLAIARTPGLWRKALAVAGVVLAAVMLEGLRKGGMTVAALGAVAGLASGLVVRRPRLLLAGLVAAPILLVAVFTRPAVQARALTTVHDAIQYHAGHVVTPGFAYKLVDPRYYNDWGLIRTIDGPGAVRYVASAVAHYVAEPLPWTLQSRAMLAYMPEQVAWWTILALAPFGVWFGLRRDPVLTCLLASHAGAVMMLVALTSGNIGTLIRHRGLVMPYVAWLGMLGAYGLFESATRPAAATDDRTHNGNG